MRNFVANLPRRVIVVFGLLAAGCAASLVFLLVPLRDNFGDPCGSALVQGTPTDDVAWFADCGDVRDMRRAIAMPALVLTGLAFVPAGLWASWSRKDIQPKPEESGAARQQVCV